MEEASSTPSTGNASNDQRVLVTGASGFIASHCVQQMQAAGYAVRGTVRSLANAKKVVPLYQMCPGARHKLELVEADLLDDQLDNWKEAVSGCTYVLHVASPFPNEIPTDEQVLIKPAVEGTLNVLRACAEVGGVKRVVLTSSVAAVVGQTAPDFNKTYSEADWTDLQQDVGAYQKSKTLAEKAAWDYVNKLPEDKRFELTTINPSYVMGPVIHGSTGTSQEVVGRLMRHEVPALPHISLELCDVRNVAQAHIRAMTLPAAAGQRFIINSGGMWFKEMATLLDREFRPQGYRVPTLSAPKFLASIVAWFDKALQMVMPRWGQQLHFDNSKMKNVLEIQPYPPEKTLLDMAYSMVDNELIPRTAQYKGQPTAS
ncbi:uncharacterized protein LOC129584643 [Paramacrobiotus metropolitanus]|uniref:uncharacterized protein LOC129584643 n=1 Tax=Paramacrobiotus metropolitanus TaxID=2943436 RepID=UPI0024460DC9|nr:uncharacterized protein LOC129584643 [Paramacrobiotus metropolitanus]